MAAEPGVGELFASTFEKVVTNKPSDAIFNSSRLLKILSGDGGKGFRGKESVDGGREFELTIEYKTNPNDGPIGEFDTIPTTHAKVFTAARFPIAIHAGAVTFSELEVARARGMSAKIQFVADKLKNEVKTHAQNLNKYLYGDGTGSPRPIGGLQSIISATPTSGIVGGIDRGVQGFWRNQQLSGAKSSTAFDNLRSAMRTVYNLCSSGGSDEAPKAWITDRPSFEGYVSLLVPGERFIKESDVRGGDAGWDNDAISFNGKPGYYDEEAAIQAPGNLYFLNPEYLKLYYLEGHWMKKSDKQQAFAQLGFAYTYHTFGQLCTSNPRRLGVVTSIS